MELSFSHHRSILHFDFAEKWDSPSYLYSRWKLINFARQLKGNKILESRKKHLVAKRNWIRGCFPAGRINTNACRKAALCCLRLRLNWKKGGRTQYEPTSFVFLSVCLSVLSVSDGKKTFLWMNQKNQFEHEREKANCFNKVGQKSGLEKELTKVRIQLRFFM